MTNPSPPSSDVPLSDALPGSWRLVSRIDVDAAGVRRPEPMLGEHPLALLFYDRGGNFAAQFMRRDRSAPAPEAARTGPAGGNNTQAHGGYDAYFGTYRVDDATGVVTQELTGALTPANVGAVLARTMTIVGDELVIRLETSAADGTPVTRTLSWVRVG